MYTTKMPDSNEPLTVTDGRIFDCPTCGTPLRWHRLIRGQKTKRIVESQRCDKCAHCFVGTERRGRPAGKTNKQKL